MKKITPFLILTFLSPFISDLFAADVYLVTPFTCYKGGVTAADAGAFAVDLKPELINGIDDFRKASERLEANAFDFACDGTSLDTDDLCKPEVAVKYFGDSSFRTIGDDFVSLTRFECRITRVCHMTDSEDQAFHNSMGNEVPSRCLLPAVK